MASYVSLRKVTSLTALLSFAALLLSSVVVYLAPRGQGSGRWGALGLDKHEWSALHTNLGLLFVIAGIVHIVLNFKPIVCYLRNRRKQLRVLTLNFNLSLLLTVWVVAGSVLDWPPFDFIREFKDGLSGRSARHEAVDAAGESMPEKPPLLYSRWTVKKLCQTYGLQPGRTVRELRRFGIEAGPEETIRAVAEANDMHPSSVYDAVRQISTTADAP